MNRNRNQNHSIFRDPSHAGITVRNMILIGGPNRAKVLSHQPWKTHSDLPFAVLKTLSTGFIMNVAPSKENSTSCVIATTASIRGVEAQKLTMTEWTKASTLPMRDLPLQDNLIVRLQSWRATWFFKVKNWFVKVVSWYGSIHLANPEGRDTKPNRSMMRNGLKSAIRKNGILIRSVISSAWPSKLQCTVSFGHDRDSQKNSKPNGLSSCFIRRHVWRRERSNDVETTQGYGSGRNVCGAKRTLLCPNLDKMFFLPLLVCSILWMN